MRELWSCPGNGIRFKHQRDFAEARLKGSPPPAPVHFVCRSACCPSNVIAAKERVSIMLWISTLSMYMTQKDVLACVQLCRLTYMYTIWSLHVNRTMIDLTRRVCHNDHSW